MTRTEAARLQTWVEERLAGATRALSDALIAAPTPSAAAFVKRHRDAIEKRALELEAEARRDMGGLGR